MSLTLRPPTPAEIREIGAQFHMDLTDEEVADFAELMADKMGTYERIHQLDPTVREHVDATRRHGERPTGEEDPYNAVVRRCHVDAGTDGSLAGLTVMFKDNIAVGGVEMTCGSSVLRGHVPEFDATIVERVLGAGGTVAGKTNMSAWAVSGTGELTETGPVLNPHDDTHLAGGSSGGSAVAVVTGEADLAFGTDQAGSVRVPAAWSGCVGLKPTFGLVPYTGAVSLGGMYDHVGPMARDVETCARALDVVSGTDPHDHRQTRVPTGDYQTALGTDPGEITVGVLTEGFEADNPVDEAVRDAINRFESAGATVRDVSVPYHEDGNAVWQAMTNETSSANMAAEGVGHYVKGWYDTQFVKAFGNARRASADDFPPTLKISTIFGQYIKEQYRGYYHAKAQNLNIELTEAYDEGLDGLDALLLPTTPVTAFEHERDLSRPERVRHAQGKRKRGRNTMQFNVTGHPAMSVPAGTVEELPVGLMIVGAHFDDASVLSVGDAFERAVAVV